MYLFIKCTIQLCDCLSISEYDKECIILDFKSFKFVALNKKEIGGNPISDLLEVNMGYQHLRKLAESVLCIPIATATVERSFSAMNRIMSKTQNFEIGWDKTHWNIV
ncbi:unnamed protein product [Macrosiphum euphorbiae]|uniref:HAT C-terminal dimerisation domain-containing protein n=1 Tax=Macrosiphum euphorbiae TaxID=13131 RepID=A0AAV0WHE9_9HEMI|nr:unnamed protein product [Macrosiphum euphorbiae]